MRGDAANLTFGGEDYQYVCCIYAAVKLAMEGYREAYEQRKEGVKLSQQKANKFKTLTQRRKDAKEEKSLRLCAFA